MSARQSGFTLVELVVGLTISVVVVGFIATFIAVPVQSHLAQARRRRLCRAFNAVPCSQAAYLVNGAPVTIYAVTVTSSRGVYGTPEFVSRAATVRISSL